MKGSIDKLTTTGAVGWLYAPNTLGKPIVEAVLDETLIGRSAAELYRPDLKQVGFGDGGCGFEMSFQRPIEPEYLPFVAFHPEGSDLLLPLTSPLGFIELASAILRGFPRAGRTRSILGGLWTDRTDAPQLLRSRIAVGSCDAELQIPIQDLTLRGYVILQGVLGPTGSIDAELIQAALDSLANRSDHSTAGVRSALSSLSSLLFREPVVRLLRTVFDDFPVVYRLDCLRESTSFGQAGGVEPLPSPAECLLLYLGSDKASIAIESLQNSHELPELGPNGRSRWSPDGGDEIAKLVSAASLSVEVLDLGPSDLLIVGPGLIHRTRANQGAPVVRAFCAPKRLSPLRFLTGDNEWSETRHFSGAAIRL